MPPVLVIHGGAGVIKQDMTPAKERAMRPAMNKMLLDGYARLKPALDAVTAAIQVLEGDPNFNAGKVRFSRMTAGTSWMRRSWTATRAVRARWRTCNG